MTPYDQDLDNENDSSENSRNRNVEEDAMELEDGDDEDVNDETEEAVTENIDDEATESEEESVTPGIDEDDDDNDSSKNDSTPVQMATIPCSNGVPLSTKHATLPSPGLSSTNAITRRPGVSPKIRIRLKLPTQANANKSTTNTTATTSMSNTAQNEAVVEKMNAMESNNEQDDDAKAMIVTSSDDRVDTVSISVAPADTTIKKEKINRPKILKKSLPIAKRDTISSIVATTTTTNDLAAGVKRRAFQASKQVKIPPIASPGLLMLTSGQGPRQAAAAAAALAYEMGVKDGHVSAQQLFQTTMANAGYTIEQRTMQPHRGSSIEKTVGDLFDTNVKLAVKPINLIPSDLWNTKRVELDGTKEVRLTEILLQNLEKSKSHKRPRCTPFQEMVPVSLTIPYPEHYIQQRLEYMQKVSNREAAIIEWQAMEEQLETEREEVESREFHNPDFTASDDRLLSYVNTVKVPPIPIPPEPPRVQDLITPDNADFDGTHYFLDPTGQNNSPEVQHPIYIPKNNEKLVVHLDKNCFHITEGRYFGLKSSRIADPNFVGPNAPGISGVTSGGGLATATTSTTTSTSGLSGGGMTMILSNSFHSAAAVPPNKDGVTAGTNKEKMNRDDNNDNDKVSLQSTVDAGGTGVATSKASPKTVLPPERIRSSTSIVAKKMQHTTVQSPLKATKTTSKVFVKTTKSMSDLRKIMESNEASTDLVAAFKDVIIKAAVESSFKGRNGTHFLGPDGETYPDISKAFAAYSALKACERCKSNKQGVCLVIAFMSAFTLYGILTCFAFCFSGIPLPTSSTTQRD